MACGDLFTSVITSQSVSLISEFRSVISVSVTPAITLLSVVASLITVAEQTAGVTPSSSSGSGADGLVMRWLESTSNGCRLWLRCRVDLGVESWILLQYLDAWNCQSRHLLHSQSLKALRWLERLRHSLR